MARQSRDPTSGRGFRLFRLAGIDVRIHPSWVIIFALLFWSISGGYLPRAHPDHGAAAYWISGLAATILFFLSLLIHEFAHSLVAKSAGITVPEIILFALGGISRPSKEAGDPRTEIRIAAAGPLSSFVLAGVFWGLAKLTGGDRGLATAVLGYLAWVNVALGIFNLVPGFPLDGGRVLRAVLWWKTGSLHKATKRAADMGKAVAIGLVVLGTLQIFWGGPIGGLWMIFIGFFLMAVAEGSYQQTLLRRLIADVPVRDVMVEQVVSVPPDATARELVTRYFLHYGYKGFPVTKDGRVIGMVALDNIKALDEEALDRTSVGQIMLDLDETDQITPDMSLSAVFRKMNRQGSQRLVVMDQGQMVGLITKTGLYRFLKIKKLLDH